MVHLVSAHALRAIQAERHGPRSRFPVDPHAAGLGLFLGFQLHELSWTLDFERA